MSRMSQPWSCRGGLGRLRGVLGHAQREKGSGAGGVEAASRRRNPLGWAPPPSPCHRQAGVPTASRPDSARSSEPTGPAGMSLPIGATRGVPRRSLSVQLPAPQLSPRRAPPSPGGSSSSSAPQSSGCGERRDDAPGGGKRTPGISGSAPRPRIAEPSRTEPERRRAPLPAAGPTCTAPPPVPSAAAAAAEARSRGGREDERPLPAPGPAARPRPGPTAPRVAVGGGASGARRGGHEVEVGGWGWGVMR